jgi:Tol biopolymer transport system component
MHRLIRLAPPAALLALVLLLPGCDGGGPTDLGGALSLATQGRLERGSTVTLAATSDGQVLAPSAVQVSATPSDAVQVLADGRLRLLRAGRVVITATAPNRVGSITLDVARPPVVVFDLVTAGNRDLWRVDLDGQSLTRLTEDPADDGDPTAAAGTVVFVSFRSGNADLYSVPLAGGTATRLTTTPRNESTPALSPDGTKLAYALDVSGITKVWSSSATGAGAAAVVPAGFGFTGAIETSPTWAPGGSRVVYVSTSNGTADLWDYAFTGQPALFEGSPQAEVEPAWSPDGSWVVFASNREAGNTDLYLKRVSTGAVTRLTTSPASEAQAAWTPDGRIVYVENASGTAHLRWMDPADPATTTLISTGAGNPAHPAAAAAP